MDEDLALARIAAVMHERDEHDAPVMMAGRLGENNNQRGVDFGPGPGPFPGTEAKVKSQKQQSQKQPPQQQLQSHPQSQQPVAQPQPQQQEAAVKTTIITSDPVIAPTNTTTTVAINNVPAEVHPSVVSTPVPAPESVIPSTQPPPTTSAANPLPTDNNNNNNNNNNTANAATSDTNATSSNTNATTSNATVTSNTTSAPVTPEPSSFLFLSQKNYISDVESVVTEVDGGLGLGQGQGLGQGRAPAPGSGLRSPSGAGSGVESGQRPVLGPGHTTDNSPTQDKADVLANDSDQDSVLRAAFAVTDDMGEETDAGLDQGLEQQQGQGQGQGLDMTTPRDGFSPAVVLPATTTTPATQTATATPPLSTTPPLRSTVTIPPVATTPSLGSRRGDGHSPLVSRRVGTV